MEVNDKFPWKLNTDDLAAEGARTPEFDINPGMDK